MPLLATREMKFQSHRLTLQMISTALEQTSLERTGSFANLAPSSRMISAST